MDETLQELENELKRLTPRRPSPSLRQALEHELCCEQEAGLAPRYGASAIRRFWKWGMWSLAGAAAALAVVAAWQINRHSAPATAPVFAGTTPVVAPKKAVSSGNRYEPVKATSVLYDMQEDGAATLPDQTEGRQVRYRYVDTYTWKNPATKASLRWSVPRDEVRLVRASLD